MLGLETKLLDLLLMLFSSVLIRVILVSIGQNWVRSTAHSATLCCLPIITYAITGAISGNIALSLGMVGALSIVRFRNPVRSPLELSAYFASITIGITASVSLKWLLFLNGSIIFVFFFFWAWSRVHSMVTGKPLLTSSFSEGNSTNTLEVVSKEEIKSRNDRTELIVLTYEDGLHTHVWSSSSQSQLLKLLSEVKSTYEVKSFRLSR